MPDMADAMYVTHTSGREMSLADIPEEVRRERNP